MAQYLVVWRGEEAEFMQSCVELGDIVDPRQMTNGAWVRDAALTEGYSAADANALLEDSYELILVCDMPKNFYNT